MQAPGASPALEELTTLLERDERTATATVFETYDDARVVAFRAILASVWTLIGLLERRHPSDGPSVASTHPFPAARLHAVVSTLAEQFAELTEVELEGNGAKSRVLSEEDAAALNIFLRSVLKPIVLASIDSPSSGAATPQVRFIRETGNIILGRPTETDGGRELLAIQGLRARMTARLKRHRRFGSVP